jgi:hypothetical protein
MWTTIDRRQLKRCRLYITRVMILNNFLRTKLNLVPFIRALTVGFKCRSRYCVQGEVRLPFPPSGGSAGGEACGCAVFGECAGVESHPDIGVRDGVRDVVLRASPDHPPERVARFAVAEQFAEDGMGSNVARRCGRKSARGFCFEAIAPGYCDARQ